CDYQSIWYCNPWKVSKVEEPVHFSEKRSEDDNSSNEFNLFPNPSTSFFTIQSNSELGWVRILNASGQIVLFEQVASQQWTYQHDLAAGTYFVQTKLEPSEVRKLIVTN
ncbi:MAG: T9SS type A sorting domain-containing protein, partial [Flavobacteriales bacterium]